MYPGARVPAPLPPRRAAAPPPRRPAARARGLTFVALAIATACAVAPSTPPPAAPAPPATATQPAGEPTQILSAHLQPVAAGQAEYFGVPVAGLLYVVFSRPLDPSGVAPGRFVVLTEGGTRRVPLAARLAPASERDELRALELVIPAPARGLLSVTVVGQLFDADGRDLDGLSADVRPATAAPLPVAADRLPDGLPECPGAHVLRVWWSVPVSDGPATERLSLQAGGSLAPDRLADLACRPVDRLAGAVGCDVEDDNVIDLCFPPSGPPLSLELPPDSARDRQGQANPSARIDFPGAAP